MPQPLISVILPFYNAESTLERAIESIINQTFSNWELLLVNNLSSDDSFRIAQRYGQKDSRIHILNCTNQGVVYAFNLGLSLAQGTFIARMDADDYSHSRRLEWQLDTLLSDDTIDAVSGLVKYRAAKVHLGMKHFVDWSNSLITSDQIALNRFIELPTINPTLLFRRESLDQFGSYRSGESSEEGFPEEGFPEDYELVLRWHEHGASFAKVDKIVLDWYDLPQRLTRTDPKYSTESFYRIKSKYLANWLKAFNPFYPEVMIWGAGRKSRKRVRMLENHRLNIAGYIDVVPHKTSEKPCIFYEEIASPGQYFILSYVANRGRREEIKQFLISRGYQEGVHFLLVA